MRIEPSWAIEPILASAPFLPAGKGALILILGGLAMLAITTVLARAMAGPPPKRVPDRATRPSAPRRKTSVASASSSSSSRPLAVYPPEPAPSRSERKHAERRQPAARASSPRGKR